MQVKWLVIAVALAAFPPTGSARAVGQNPAPDKSQSPPTAPKTDEIDILSSAEMSVTPSAPASPEVKIPNFASCPIADLQSTVPELAHLKAAQDQSGLTPLLDKIGDKTVEIAHKTPNLISDEAVVAEDGGVKTRQNYSFLVLQHVGSKAVVFDEYRVDVASGRKFQTEDFEKAVAANSKPASALELPDPNRKETESGTAPNSQGFVNDWLHFYPSNRRQSEFRYLGQQKMDGHKTLVVAFAQKPGSVTLPAMIGFDNKSLPIFMQGVAWVDASDFRIVRLRTDLLAAPAGVPLRQLTADIQFVQVGVVDIASSLWLPRQVVVTTNFAGTVRRETHTYSNYRLFRTHSKIVLNP